VDGFAGQSGRVPSQPTNSARDADNISFENTLNWQKGSHTFNFGGNYTNFEAWLDNQQLLPELRFGVVQGDPSEGMFNTSNFPGASNAVLTAARNYYAIMTGRISEVRGIARLNEATGQYEYLGLGTQRAQQREVGLWLQDSWRANPNLSLNFGVRYEMPVPPIDRGGQALSDGLEQHRTQCRPCVDAEPRERGLHASHHRREQR
jgi:outer membrane receptor protein involved in Fe transport